jgi:hypothetical protein
MEYITDDNVIVVYSNVGLGDKLIFFFCPVFEIPDKILRQILMKKSQYMYVPLKKH